MMNFGVITCKTDLIDAEKVLKYSLINAKVDIKNCLIIKIHTKVYIINIFTCSTFSEFNYLGCIIFHSKKIV